MTHYEGGRFRYELPPLAEPASITLEGGDDWTARSRSIPSIGPP